MEELKCPQIENLQKITPVSSVGIHGLLTGQNFFEKILLFSLVIKK